MADVEINLETSNPKELVAQAVRAYAIGDFSNAAAAFGRATQLMAQEHGDEHDSLGEIYVQYARSLLELTREENEPLGDAIPHGDTDSDSEDTEVENGEGTSEEKTTEDDKKEEKDEKKTENGDVKESTTNDNSKESSTDDNSKDKTEKVEANGNTETDKTAETSEEVNGADEPSEVADDENLSDLQLAWEVLEVAKKIFTERGDAGKEKLAETMILLGEVAMESENFNDGVNDMKAGLEMQKGFLEQTSRKLAETYYKVGTALVTISNTAEAVENFEASIKILENRIEFLEKQSDEGKTDFEKKDKASEIDDMKALIPEIKEKINDTKVAREEMTAQILQELTGNKGKSEAKTEDKESAASSSKAATDISHLVKRKRKADEEPVENKEIQPAKKPTP